MSAAADADHGTAPDDARQQRVRLTIEQARTELLNAGLELVAEIGPAAGFEQITLPAVIERTNVPRPSAYRAFREEGRAAIDVYRAALVVSVVEATSEPDEALVSGEVSRVLEQAQSMASDATALEMTELLRELIRVILSSVSETQTPLEASYLTVLASTVDKQPSDAAVSALKIAESERHAVYANLLRELCQVFGLRLREPMTFERLAAAIIDASTGHWLLKRLAPGHDDMELATGPGGEPQRWSSLAVWLYHVARSALVPDPRIINAADLTLLDLP